MLEKALAEWKGGAAAEAMRTSAISPAKSARLILIDKPGAEQSVITVSQLGTERKSPDFYSLTVMNTIFGGGFMSRLNMNLREDKGYTYGARSSFDWHVHAAGTFTASSSVKTDVTASALAEFLKEIGGIRGEEPVEMEELENAKKFITRGYTSEFETISQVAGRLEGLVEYGLPDDYFNTLIPQISAVTAEEVTKVAEKYLHPENLTIVIVGDREKVQKSLEDLMEDTPVELMKFDDDFQLVPTK
jgi:zinc protease